MDLFFNFTPRKRWLVLVDFTRCHCWRLVGALFLVPISGSTIALGWGLVVIIFLTEAGEVFCSKKLPYLQCQWM